MTTCLLVSAPFSGIEVHFRRLARELTASDRIDRVDAIWLEHEPTEGLSRLPPFRWNWFLAAAHSTSRQFGELRKAGASPDVALFNHLNPAVLLNPVSRLPPVVLHLDTTPVITASMGEHYLGRSARHPAVERLKLGVYRPAFRAARHVIGVSELVKRSLMEDYRVPAESISVIPFPVDTEFWKLQADSPSRADALRVVFVGGHWQRKGGDQVLAAARRPEFADCEFHVVTMNDVPDPPSNVFVHRDVPPESERLRALYASASVFVLPTWADVSGIAITEAMAMELPIVTTDVGGIPELVLDTHNGYVVRPGDVDAFVERLRALIQDSELRTVMGRRGRSKVEAGYSLASNVPRYVDVLEGRTPLET